MKTRILIFLSAAALLTNACLREDESARPENTVGKITFRLPAPRVSRATIPALVNENQLDDLYIYMFNSSGMLENIFPTSNIDLQGTGPDRTATIDVTGRAGKKTFCFMGNAVGRSAELDSFEVGITTLTAFREVLTDQSAIHLGPVLPMSGTTVIEQVTEPSQAAGETEVNLKRRVARFDVLNDASDTNFEIQNILISNANLRGYLLSDATGDPVKTIETGNLPVIDFNTTDFPNANTADLVEGAFYIYPTDLEEGKTELSIEGLFNSQTRVYKVPVASTVPILANNRYVLKARKVDIYDIEWSIEVDPWEDGSEVTVLPPEDDMVKMSSVAVLVGRAASLDQTDPTNIKYDLTLVAQTSTLRFTTASTDKRGTSIEIRSFTYETTDNPLPGFDVTTPTPVLTYDGKYTQVYDIFIPNRATGARVEVVLMVTNNANPLQRFTLTIWGDLSYPGTTEMPVRIDGRLWAPVNVGASTVEYSETLESRGYIYQWGRNSPFRIDVAPTIQAGPVTYAQSLTTYASAFITNTTMPRDWMNDAANLDLRNGLWTPEVNDSPCPAGWRVPTSAELQFIVGQWTARGGVNRNSRLEFPADGGEGTLYLPLTGRLNYSTGAVSVTTSAYYWSSSMNGDNSDFLSFSSGAPTISNYYRSYGLSVRCVSVIK